MKIISMKQSCFLALALLAAPVSADYLYTMVENAGDLWGSALLFDYMTVSIDDGASNLQIHNTSGTAVGTHANSIEPAKNSTSPYYFYFDEELSSERFFVQLWNSGQSEALGWTTLEFDSVSENIFGGTSSGGAKPLVLTSFVPEPSSGILMLLGLAALAMRRKPQII